VIALMLALLGARAQEEATVEPARRERKKHDRDPEFWGAPLRVDIGTAFREEMRPAAVFGLGTQLARSRKLALEAQVAFMPLHGFVYPGPFRSMGSWDATADVTWLASRWLAVGPTGGVSYRMFNQQGSAIAQAFVPVAGLRANTAFLRARHWSFAVTTKINADLGLTRLVLETNEVRPLPVLEGQIGLRFNLGRSTVPEVKE
jgi:hypothetical protein